MKDIIKFIYHELEIKDNLEIIDILDIINDNKKCTRITILNEKILDKFIEFFKKHTIFFKLSKGIGNPYTLEFSNSFIINSTYILYCYISKYEDMVLERYKNDRFKHYENFGKFLSYPLCCIKNFSNENFVNIPLKKLNPNIQKYTIDKRMNCFNYKYSSFINYAFCDFYCEETLSRLEKRTDIIYLIYSTLYDKKAFEEYLDGLEDIIYVHKKNFNLIYSLKYSVNFNLKDLKIEDFYILNFK